MRFYHWIESITNLDKTLVIDISAPRNMGYYCFRVYENILIIDNGIIHPKDITKDMFREVDFKMYNEEIIKKIFTYGWFK